MVTTSPHTNRSIHPFPTDDALFWRIGCTGHAKGFPAEFGTYRPRRQACRSSLFKSATHRRLVASSARQRSWVLWAVSPCVRDS